MMVSERCNSRHLKRTVRLLAVLLLLLTGAGLGNVPGHAQAAATCPTVPAGNVDQKTAAPFAVPGCAAVPNNPMAQSVFSWKVSAAQANELWSFSVSGIAGNAEILSVYKDPGDPSVSPQKIADFTEDSAGSGIRTQPFLLRAGSYFFGVATVAAGAYTLTVKDEGGLPKSGDAEPNDSAAAATPVKTAFSLSGDLQGSDDWYAWTLSKGDAAKHWSLSLLTPMTESTYLNLRNAAGDQLASLQVNPAGRADLSDLGLEAGTYSIEITYQADHPLPYVLQSVAGANRSPDTENEPNGAVAQANPWDVANPIYGHIANGSDIDYYKFHVDKTLAASLFDLTLMASPGLDRKMCLVDSDGADTTCKENKTGLVALSGLSMTEGDHVFRVSGDPSTTDEYSVDLLVTGKVQPGQESQPNDSVKTANLLNQSNSITGKFGAGDGDRHVFHLHTDGDPQLWRIEALGGGISQLRSVDASDTTLADGTVSSDGTYAVLSDQYLTPGEHWFSVSGVGGQFSLTATPTGAPDPNGEREPNNDLADSEILKIGQTRTGRLADNYDTDVYRFSLAATEHVLIKIQSPADGQLHADVQWNGSSVQTVDAKAAGELDTMDLLLKPGDYAIWMRAITPGEQKYQLSFERADPFVLAVDQEPNNSFADASPLPSSLSITGTVGDFNDDDWFALPALPAAADLVMTYSTKQIAARIFDAAGNEILVSIAADGLSGEAQLPAGQALGLKISGSASYKVDLVFTPGPKPVGPAKSPVTVALSFTTDQVAAYWKEGQRVDGALKLTNSGLLPQSVDLAAVTSHYAWTLGLSQTTVLVPPGGAGVTVPVALTIQPDAWAGIPVRMTVRALSKNGAIATGFVEITPGRDAAPSQPRLLWPLPAALLGGLDVASLALGAQVQASVDQAGEEQLHDGFASSGGGFHTGGATFPLTLTVHLAGTDAAPIAGIILDPLNTEVPATWLRSFKLMLSTDGATYTEALAGVLQPLPMEQSFVLPKPVQASYAQLVMLSSHDPSGTSTSISLGEWKVISSPGFAPAGDPINLADPVNGGHLVTMNPQFTSQDDAKAMLDADTTIKTLSIEAGVKPSWIVGFSEERAAQISELQWIDPAGTNPDQRFTIVTVEVSPDSPFGPWTKVGTWTLTRAGDGSVAPLTLDKPVWARFVRFTGNGPKGKSTWEYPAQLKIIERTTDATYQSMLGQWGYGNVNGPYELANPPVSKPLPPMQTNTSKETVLALPSNSEASGQVQIGKLVAWYTVTAPPDQNVLTFKMTGDPIADAVPHVYDASGQEIPTKMAKATSASEALYAAIVQPGKTYTVEVMQPIHSIAFAFDTSISMAAYDGMVREALKAFAADVTPGQEYVNIMPFSREFLLKDWSDQPYQIQTALSTYTDQSLSSSSEQTMLTAMAGMSGREGSKAILLVTDAETSSYEQTSQLWPALATVAPRIFAVHVGSGADGGVSRHMMQDWASATNGFYQYTETQGQMDRAFDRLATTMRRPVGFTISFATANQATPTPTATATAASVNQKPGSLQITMNPAASGQPAAISTDIAVEIILDTSGSMLQELEPGKSRIDVARATLLDLVNTKLPAGVPVAFRTFADTPGSCDTILRSPLAPLDPGTMAATIQSVGVTNLVKTPIGAALDQVANDLAGVNGPKIVVLVTDGEETCGGDPAASIKNLTAQGFDVQVNIVGFALDNEQLKATFKTWAQLGHGSYFDATNSSELNAAVDKALAPPFQVFDANGVQVASGRVGGDSISLPAGTYRVEILSNPKRTFKTVVIKPGKKTKLKFENADTG